MHNLHFQLLRILLVVGVSVNKYHNNGKVIKPGRSVLIIRKWIGNLITGADTNVG